VPWADWGSNNARVRGRCGDADADADADADDAT
jgi:hypothetical protein